MPNVLRGLRAEARSSRLVIAATIVPAVALIGLIAIASLVFGIPVKQLLSDPLAQAGVHPLLGFLSNLGLLLWASAAGACLVAVLVLRNWSGSANIESVRFFAMAGALTAVLVLDDTYQLHEDLIPRLFGRGQTFVLLGYVVVVPALFWRFRRIVLGTEWLFLATAAVCFGVSIAVDLLPVALGQLPGGLEVDTESAAYEYVSSLLEGGMKFVGIALWFAYFVRSSVAAIVARSTGPVSKRR